MVVYLPPDDAGRDGEGKTPHPTATVNRPESGSTVLTLTTVSCCPAEHSTCPEFIHGRSVLVLFYLEQQVTHMGWQDMHALSVGMLT